MSEKQICPMVRDILPLYEEQLTSEETNQIIENHLKECEACQDLYCNMKAQELEEKHIQENTKAMQEIDYLKKIRASSSRKVWLGMAGAAFLLTMMIFIKLFIYGTPTEHYLAAMIVKNEKIIVQGEFTDSALAYSHYRIVAKDGQKSLTVYAVLPSIWNHKGSFDIKCDIKQASGKGVVVKDQKITENGKVISVMSSEIYARKHLYIGDMSRNGALANTLGIAENLGNFTNELQTKAEPYGWSLFFQTPWEESNEKLYNEKMRGYAYILLATIDNLSKVTWSYPIKTADGIVHKEQSLAVMEADRVLGEEVKGFGKSEERIEELLTKVGLKDNGNSQSILNAYQYRLTLTGRMPNAVKDSTFIVLTNNKNLTFQEVAKSIYSSNSKDWLRDAIIVSIE